MDKVKGVAKMLASTGLILTLTAGGASGANLYWDTNGSASGTGADAANNGTWGTDSFWNTNSGGVGTAFRVPTTTADILHFSAGTNGTGDYAVTVNGTVGASTITFAEGNALVSGGTAIELAATASISSILPANGNGSAVINTALTGAATQLTVASQSGDITLGGANTYAGLTVISKHATSSLPAAAVYLTGTNSGGGGTRIDNKAILVLNNAAANANGGLASGTLQFGNLTSTTLDGAPVLRNGAGTTLSLSNTIAFATQTLSYVNFDGASNIDFTNTGSIHIGGLNAQSLPANATRNLVVSNAAQTVTIRGVLDDADTASNLVKRGAGRLILTAANTYDGNTIATEGVLQVDGSINTTGGVVNISGATLTGTGVIGGFTDIGGTGTVTGGTLAVAGDSVGAMVFDAMSTYVPGATPEEDTGFNSLAFTATGNAIFQINDLTPGTYDLARGGLDPDNESVRFDGALSLVFTPGFQTAGTVKIFDFANYYGSFDSVVASGLANGFTAAFDNATGIVTVTGIVPEPASIGLLALALGALVTRRNLRS